MSASLELQRLFRKHELRRNPEKNVMRPLIKDPSAQLAERLRASKEFNIKHNTGGGKRGFYFGKIKTPEGILTVEQTAQLRRAFPAKPKEKRPE